MYIACMGMYVCFKQLKRVAEPIVFYYDGVNEKDASLTSGNITIHNARFYWDVLHPSTFSKLITSNNRILSIWMHHSKAWSIVKFHRDRFMIENNNKLHNNIYRA